MKQENKGRVYDEPKVITQNFKVTLPNGKGGFIVERKEVIREQHNMGCTDGMKEGEVQKRVSYTITREVSLDDRCKCIELVREEVKNDKL